MPTENPVTLTADLMSGKKIEDLSPFIQSELQRFEVHCRDAAGLGSTAEVQEAVRSFKPNKSPGPHLVKLLAGWINFRVKSAGGDECVFRFPIYD